MTSFPQFVRQKAGSVATDDEMEQIRELLVGNLQRASEARIEALEARLRQLEEEMARRVDALAARIESLGRETTSGRHAAFEELSRNVGELSERIRSIAKS
jgi:hypothetical protein